MNHNAEMLRKTGAICPSMIRCGKSNCRCAHGRLHGPYYYRCWRDSQGRQHRTYIPKADVATALARQAEARRVQETLRTAYREFQRLNAESRRIRHAYGPERATP